MGFFDDITGKSAKRAYQFLGQQIQRGADTYTDYANRGIDEQRGALSSALDYLDPAAQTGDNARNVLASLFGANGPDASQGAIQSILSNPAYQFRLGEGLKALDRSATSRGNLYSGSTMKAAQRYGEGLASDEINRSSDVLMKLLGYGQQAGGQAAQANLGTGTNIANMLTGIGDAQRQGIVGNASSYASGKIAQSNASNNLLSQGIGLLTAPLSGGSILGRMF